MYGALPETLAAGLIDDQSALAAYPEAVAAWATAEAQVALMRRHLAERGPVDEDGEPRATALHWLNALESRAERARRVLGLVPLAEAVLARERAAAAVLTVDLEGLATRGREVIAAREAAGIVVPDLAGDALRSVVEAAPPTTMEERRAWAREGRGNRLHGGET